MNWFVTDWPSSYIKVTPTCVGRNIRPPSGSTWHPTKTQTLVKLTALRLQTGWFVYLLTGIQYSSMEYTSATYGSHLSFVNFYYCTPGSSVGIATELRAGRSGIDSRWGRDFPPVQTGSVAHPASCTVGTGSVPGVKCGRGMLLTTHPVLVPRSWKSRAIPLPTLWATPGL